MLKSNGLARMIIDLSALNEFVNKVLFKMEGLPDIKFLIDKNDFMISIDLADAFFSVPLHKESKNYTVFDIKCFYQYNVLPFGLTSSPRIFSKVLRPVIVYLRAQGVRISAYLDDIIVTCRSKQQLLSQVEEILKLLSDLGFTVNFEKSSLVPSQVLLHLGYVWNSCNLTLSLPKDKIAHSRLMAHSLLYASNVTLRQAASFLGLVESHSQAFDYAPLHFRGIQFMINNALKMGYKWDQNLTLSEECINDLKWWSSQNDFEPVKFQTCKPALYIYTDASNTGWGCQSTNGKFTFGQWSKEEHGSHINYLELKAIYFALKCFAPDCFNRTVKILTDNTTAMAYVNNKGGCHNKQLCDLAITIWNLCVDGNIGLSVSHLPGYQNDIADKFSRMEADTHDYAVSMCAYSKLLEKISYEPEVDLFASRNTCKIKTYVSRRLDPFAWKTDAFSFTWTGKIYMFPPINLISRVVAKFASDKVENGLLITPFWPGLVSLSKILNYLIDDPILLPDNCLLGKRPTHHNFHLVAWNISTQIALTRAYQGLRQKRCYQASLQEHLLHTSGPGRVLESGMMRRGIKLVFLYQ